LFENCEKIANNPLYTFLQTLPPQRVGYKLTAVWWPMRATLKVFFLALKTKQQKLFQMQSETNRFQNINETFW